MPAPAPLEKQLLHLNLSKGTNERERPETADQETCFTRVENLVQDQTGGYIKRPGNTSVASTYASSQALTKPSRLLRTTEGLALINYYGGFAPFEEAYGKFLSPPTRTASDRVVGSLTTNKAVVVGSSGPNTSAQIVAAASSSKYHAVVSYGGVDASANSIKMLTIVDRESGNEAISYVLGDIMGGYVNVNDTVKMAFVGDRYLVVFQGSKAVSIDTGGTTITKTSAHAFEANTAFPGGYDIAVSSTRAFIVSTDVAGVYSIYAVDAATAVAAESFVLTEASFIYVKGDDIYFSGASKLGARKHANLATQTYAAYNHTIPATIAGFYIDAVSNWAWYVVISAPAFGTTTTSRIDIYQVDDVSTGGQLGVAQTTGLDGWQALSQPFQCGAEAGPSDTQPVYLHAVKKSGTELAQHAVLNISSHSGVTNNAQSHYTVRVENALEPYNGVYVASEGPTPYRVWETSPGMCSPVVPVRISPRACAFAFFDLRSSFHSRVNSVSFGGSDHISGGVHSMWDGRRLNEVGFIDNPLLNVSQSGTAGAIAAGIYNFIAVYRHVNSKAAGAFSRVSSISTLTNAGSFKNAVSVLPCFFTNRVDAAGAAIASSGGSVIVDLYRTTSGGTTYYLCASSQNGTPLGSLLTQSLLLQSTGRFTVADNLTDAQLASQPQLYRQPGTPNTSLDRYPPPSGNIACQHADRVFCVDPYGSRVYYSSFFVDGETQWFNPAFSMFVHGGSGPITAIASLDGRLVVFKKDAIFVIDGDGPAESGPSGNEFGPPRRIATEYGCVDARSLIVTTEGIAYRSPRGIELLTRSLQVKWVGDRVQNTCNAYPYTCGVALDTFGRVRWLFAATDPGVGNVSSSGRELVWDIPADCWTVCLHTPSDAVYGNSMQDIVRADVHGYGEAVFLADPLLGIVVSDSAVGVDGSAYIPTVMETSWIRTGQQARQRITDAYFLAKKIGNHAIKISCAYDYNDSYTESVTWEPGVINTLTIEELVLQLSKPQSLAFRIKIEEQAAADQGSYPTGTGLGCAYLGVTFNVMPMVGAPHVGAGSRVGGGGTAYPEPLVSGVCDATGDSAGGVAVRVLGRGFTGTTGVLFGTTAATSVVVVSDYEVTCVTPAHAVGAVSVTLTTPGGSYSAPAAYTFTSAAFAGIASLPLSLWLRDYAGLTWASLASASPGTSGEASHVVNTSGVSDPVAGTLNGHPTAIFNGTTDYTPVQCGFYGIVRPVIHFQILVKFNSLQADAGGVNNPGIFADAASYCQFTVSAGGAQFIMYDGPSATYISSATQPIVAGQWYLLRGGWDGLKVYLTADSASYPSGVSCTNTSWTTVRLGTNYATATFADMELAEFIVSGTWLTPAEEAGIRAELNARYALSL